MMTYLYRESHKNSLYDKNHELFINKKSKSKLDFGITIKWEKKTLFLKKSNLHSSV